MRRLALLVALAAACSSGCLAPSSPPPSSSAPSPPAPSTAAASSAGCEAPEARQLDFWIGDWDVTVRARDSEDSERWSEQRGENHVRATLGRCAIEESFRAEGPGQPWGGHSVSAYDRQARAWRQAWVDDSGSYLAFQGGPEAGGFVLYGEPRGVNGQERRMRMVFKDVGRERLSWSWERSTAGGAWTPMMRIQYTRQRAVPAAGTACEADPSFHDLDFWVGDWKVTAGGEEVGENHIEKILAGCAVVERWKDSRGGRGESLFYHPPGTSSWRQVWITDQATAVGGAKEKHLVERLPGGGLRFQGELPLPEGGTVLDRTTLEPLPGGKVRQRIDRSKDRGATWTTGFDAEYRR